MKTEENISLTEESKKQDKQDHFSDIEDSNDSFQVNVNFIKNKTTTSNFNFNIEITNEPKEKNKSQNNSRRNTRLSLKDFLESHQEIFPNLKEQNYKKSKNKIPKPKMNTSKTENSTTFFENSSIMKKNIEISLSENDIIEGENSENEYKKEPQTPNTKIYSYYQKLRDDFEKTGILFEDKDFPCNQSIFCNERENPDGEFEIEFERPAIEEDGICFFSVEPHASSNYNIEHEFKISRGILNDKFFVGAVLMLFQKYNEYFTNLVLDFQHVNDNLKAGFCGFQFFIDGEWKTVTVDTKLPCHQRGEFSLSKALTPKSPFWISLFEKAYAKLFGSYTVLNDNLLKDYLVDFTGGWSKMIKINKDNLDEKSKKFYFDEIMRCIGQGYLIGCMKYDEEKIKDELNESISDKDNSDEEKIILNTIYTILNIVEYENLKLIFLCNHWNKGKLQYKYGPEDEIWEINKKLTEKLEYTVSTTDGTFWMLFDDFIISYNTIYYCRIFPEEWANYVIPGIWSGESSGGSPQNSHPWFPEQRINLNQNKVPIGRGTTYLSSNLATASIVPKNKISMKKTTNISNSDKSTTGQKSPIKVQSAVSQIPLPPKKEIAIQCDFKRNIIIDTEEAFFLNPQYKIEVKNTTKIIISLMQKDQKINNGNYVKMNFIVVYTKGKYSRIWDLDERRLIKKAINDKEDGNRREIVMNIDFREIIRRYNCLNMKKLSFNKERIYINLIPYLEYTAKYEIEKKGNQRIFKPYRPEANYWLRIFANEDIYINELKRPFENKINGSWVNGISSGGPRFILNKKKYVENSHWPNNPQYLIKYKGNVKCKIILKKVGGHFANEETKVGLIITKPSYYDEDKEKLIKNNIEKHKKYIKEKIKLAPIQRIVKSTDNILRLKEVDLNKIFPKLSLNQSELIYESSYNNTYCASIQITLNRLDSPMIFIPTLSDRNASFDYEMKIYSNKQIEIYPLFNENCVTLSGEWNNNNAGGSHMTANENESKFNVDNGYKKLTYFDNPKFILEFDSKQWIKDLEFEILLSRMNSIWKNRLSQNIVNAMMSCYIFKNEKNGKWKKLCVNKDKIDFRTKDTVIIKFTAKKADPKGYILMPITYAKDVYGPFNILVKCNQKIKLTEVSDEDDIK